MRLFRFVRQRLLLLNARLLLTLVMAAIYERLAGSAVKRVKASIKLLVIYGGMDIDE